MHAVYTIYGKEPISSNLHISKKLCRKVLKYFLQASLAEVFMWAKFHVKIRKYGCAGKVGFYRENSLKPRYLARNKPGGRTFFTIDIAHYGLQDAQRPD